MLIYVGIPVLDGKPYAALVDSLLAEQLLGYGQGVHLLVDWQIGCSLIGSARNELAKRFLATKEADCLVFVDGDISWSAGALIGLAKRPEKVVGGTYRAKRADVRFHVLGHPRKAGRLYEVDGIPGGFMKIDRSAFEAITPNQYLAEGEVTSDYFPEGFFDGGLYGEDYGFCRLWRATGGKVFVDPAIDLRHHDGMTMYVGSARNWLRKEARKCP